MKKSAAWTSLCLLIFPASTFAQDAPGSNMPNSGFFVGAGGSHNATKLDRDVVGIGISNVYVGSELVASGEAAGPAPPYRDTESSFALDAQAGAGVPAEPLARFDLVDDGRGRGLVSTKARTQIEMRRFGVHRRGSAEASLVFSPDFSHD